MNKRAIKTSKIPDKIIKLLSKRSGIQFKEFKSNLDVSGQTLTIHLKSLLDDKLIKYEKRGREKFYYLDNEAGDDSNIKIFSCNHSNQIEKLSHWGYYIDDRHTGNYDEEDNDEDDLLYKETLDNLIDGIGTYFLFTLLKGVETGNNWFDGFNKDDIAAHILDQISHELLGSNVAFDNNLIMHLDEYNFDTFFRQVNLLLDDKGKEKLKIIFQKIATSYSSHYEALNQSMKKDYKHSIVFTNQMD